MKFMGLAVVFMVLNVLSPAAAAPAPIIFFLPVAPAALPAAAAAAVAALPAAAGALLTPQALLTGKTLAVKGAVLAKGGIAAFATAAAVTASRQLQEEEEHNNWMMKFCYLKYNLKIVVSFRRTYFLTESQFPLLGFICLPQDFICQRLGCIFVHLGILFVFTFDTVSANVMIWVPQMGESGQMVLEKVKLA